MSGFYGTAQPLTRKMLEDAIDRVRHAPPVACGITKPHVLSPHDNPSEPRVCWECGAVIAPKP